MGALTATADAVTNLLPHGRVAARPALMAAGWLPLTAPAAPTGSLGYRQFAGLGARRSGSDRARLFQGPTQAGALAAPPNGAIAFKGGRKQIGWIYRHSTCTVQDG